jgi:hypothetical protein
MTTPPLLDPRQAHRQRAGEPELVRDLPQQRGTGMRYQPRSVRRDFYRYGASITHPVKVKPPSSGFATFSKPKNPLPAGRSRALRSPGGRGRYRTTTARSGLARLAEADHRRSSLITSAGFTIDAEPEWPAYD